MSKSMQIGVAKANTGLDGISWNILGQTYVPKQHSENSLSWHATFRPGPSCRRTSTRIRMSSSTCCPAASMSCSTASPASPSPATLSAPQGVPHGLFNKSQTDVKCLFWVSPARRLYDLFWALHNLGPTPDIADVVALAAHMRSISCHHPTPHEHPHRRRRYRRPDHRADAAPAGIAAEIFEQAPTVREVGVGINTLPHAIGELADLGLLPALERIGIRNARADLLQSPGPGGLARATRDRGRTPRAAILHPSRPPADRAPRRRARASRPRRDPYRPEPIRLIQDEGGVTAHFTDTRRGDAGHTARGDVLVCADGIHSVARRRFYPGEGPPRWNGMMMWRGAAEVAPWRDGRTMAIGGGMGAKSFSTRSPKPRATVS